MIPQPHFVQIDEDGYFKMDDLRVADVDSGREWLANIEMQQGRAITQIDGVPIYVEAFDEPYIALDLSPKEAGWHATMPYGHTEPVELETLSLDEWDRFHGRTKRGIPFVLSRAAQARFFEALDAYDDDWIEALGRRYETKPWLIENPDANASDWWSELYRGNEARWDKNAPSPALSLLVPQLKLQRSRILVLGCGQGHDAAWFAQAGHLVTGIDFSDEAIARAKATYGHVHDLTFIKGDAFRLPPSMDGAFDIVFEHTLYCAISPERRNELVKAWRRALVETGHLMGVFFTFDKPMGPPFGGSEWELRSRLAKSFRPLYWQRLRNSIPERLGTELYVYADKRQLL
ncbi:MAG: methyltransferase domain-containing protein [Bdellovibrionota bacterium]